MPSTMYDEDLDDCSIASSPECESTRSGVNHGKYNRDKRFSTNPHHADDDNDEVCSRVETVASLPEVASTGGGGRPSKSVNAAPPRSQGGRTSTSVNTTLQREKVQLSSSQPTTRVKKVPTAEATTTLTLKAAKPTPNTPMLEGSKKEQGTWEFIGYNEKTLSYDSRSIKTGKTFRVHSFKPLKSVVLYCDEPTTALTDDFKAETDHEEKNHPHVEEEFTTPISPTSSSKPVSSEASGSGPWKECNRRHERDCSMLEINETNA